MDFKIEWAEPAIDALGAIVRFIATENPAAARRVGEELLERIQIASRFPSAGPVFQAAAPLEVRCLTQGNYRLYYRVHEARRVVEIVAVRHSAQQLPTF